MILILIHYEIYLSCAISACISNVKENQHAKKTRREKQNSMNREEDKYLKQKNLKCWCLIPNNKIKSKARSLKSKS